MNERVLIIGAGLAGMAAATVLAERGLKVHVVERESFLGGRAGSFEDRLADGTPFQMERGFHAFFRHYKNVRSLIARVDPKLSCLRPLADYPLLGPGGARESFAGLPKTAPLNILELVRRSPSIRFRDLVKVDTERAREMLAFEPARTYGLHDWTTAKDFLDGLRFPPAARQMLFSVFAHSFFNPEEAYSAAELLAMFHFYFTRNAEGLIFDVMREPFGPALWDPLERYLAGRGARIDRDTTALSVDRDESGRFAVAIDREGERETVHAEGLVLATEVPGLKKIVAASPALAALAPRIASLEVTAPFAVLRVWLDRPCAADRAPFAGTTGVGGCDNISIYDRFEGESARWAERTGGSVVELHAYAVDDGADEAMVRADLLSALRAFYPETRQARVLEERFLFRRDCPAFAPGSHAARPSVETPIAGVALAGDYVKLPFPSALMERSVSSGFIAANVFCRALGLREEPVHESPRRGVFAPRSSRIEADQDAARPPSARV